MNNIRNIAIEIVNTDILQLNDKRRQERPPSLCRCYFNRHLHNQKKYLPNK